MYNLSLAVQYHRCSWSTLLLLSSSSLEWSSRNDMSTHLASRGCCRPPCSDILIRLCISFSSFSLKQVNALMHTSQHIDVHFTIHWHTLHNTLTYTSQQNVWCRMNSPTCQRVQRHFRPLHPPRWVQGQGEPWCWVWVCWGSSETRSTQAVDGVGVRADCCTQPGSPTPGNGIAGTLCQRSGTTHVA